ncbi:ornithine decarboxylase [Malassezia sp. CBS 17886]|nr:ornithine decarboxylase [Malassezia sp. CBS 17886]
MVFTQVLGSGWRSLTPPPDDAAAAAAQPLAKTMLGCELYQGSTADQLRVALDAIDVDACEADGENAFFVADLAQVFRQYARWHRELPRIVPFYAVKCNPEPMILRLLAAIGTGFDCASNGEIQKVLDMGVSPARIIYANPCKASSFVRRAATQGVSLATFDNPDELHKMKRFHPSCKLVVRILTDDSKSVCQLGIKFGAALQDVPHLLAEARALGLDVVGVSFHVGSGCYDPEAYHDAIARARQAFDMGTEHGYTFDMLDIGGGFEHDNFGSIASVIRSSLDDYFPDNQFAPGGSRVRGTPNGLRIIAEPGRYFVQRAFALATNVIARRMGQGDRGDAPAADTRRDDSAAVENSTPAEIPTPAPAAMYYQNDGTYGAFNCLMFDHQHVDPKVLSLRREFVYNATLAPPGIPLDALEARDDALHPCSVWGPTCDSIDCILRLTYLPRSLNVGDWLVYENMGAYTLCAASQFNGLAQAQVRYSIGYDAGEQDGAPAAVLSLLQASGILCE